MSDDNQDLNNYVGAPYGYTGKTPLPKNPRLLKWSVYVIFLDFFLICVSLATFTSIPSAILLPVVAIEAALIFLVLPFFSVVLQAKGGSG